ncbi:hypothetical protein BV898_00583 [Hypsibius exemplaris]|uniref:Uncharacterized protein n=1 Tax=Hypsibius exemplaris TaxID=2072580 RepID=A0A1W0XE09_HYPEX|nr:hypothetical protein BV898_00583 [Hypsibius exemplaris]
MAVSLRKQKRSILKTSFLAEVTRSANSVCEQVGRLRPDAGLHAFFDCEVGQRAHEAGAGKTLGQMYLKESSQKIKSKTPKQNAGDIRMNGSSTNYVHDSLMQDE